MKGDVWGKGRWNVDLVPKFMGLEQKGTSLSNKEVV